MKKLIFTAIMVIMFVIPILLIIIISRSEMEQYQNTDEIFFKEKSYGEVYDIFRTDIEVYYEFNGKMIGDGYYYLNLEDKDYKEIIFTIKEGDEVRKGDSIAFGDGKEIFSEYDGIVRNTEGTTIVLESTESLVFETYVDIDIAGKLLKLENKNFTSETGSRITCIKISDVVTDNGVQVLFKIDSDEYLYGQCLEGLKLFTGEVYTDVLVVDKDCVYKKADGNSYVRIVDEEGTFIEERQVNTGYSTEEIICITGAEEGEWCDSGYKKVMESPEINE